MSEKADAWAHRSSGMRCATCMWFMPKGSTALGRCRRRAPTLDGFPAVFEGDWCGDHKLDEAAVRRDQGDGPAPGEVVHVDAAPSMADIAARLARGDPMGDLA